MVTLQITRKLGKLVLKLDCKGLHEHLLSIGVPRQTSYKRFEHAPGNDHLIDNVTHAITPRALCSWDSDVSGPLFTKSIDLAQYYPNPPTLETLKKLGDSLHVSVPAVLQHYQPIEITITINGKTKV